MHAALRRQVRDGQTERQTASLDSLLSRPWPFVPAAAGRPDSTACYNLEEVMCGREIRKRVERPVLLTWAAAPGPKQFKGK